MEFTLEQYFDVSPGELYDAWLDSDAHSEMTGGEASITPDLDDPYSAWDGYIWGRNLELREGEYIRQSWKTADFEEEQDYSTLEITLEPQEKGTLLKLKHSDLTDADDHYIEGWKDNYFEPMKGYFKS